MRTWHEDGVTTFERRLKSGAITRVCVSDEPSEPVRLYLSERGAWVEYRCSDERAALHRDLARRAGRGEAAE